MNLKELLKLAGKNGKVVIINEDGEVKGVFLSDDQYQHLMQVGVGEHGSPAVLDPEVVNRQILEAQLNDGVPSVQPISEPSPIKNIIAKRARDLFVTQPYGRQEPPDYDMREEVMDPNFGKPPVQPISSVATYMPQADVEADEEIKPNFDDI